MGMLWQLYEHNKEHNQNQRAQDLEGRVGQLEDQVDRQNELIGELIQRLERVLGQDLDGDGRTA